jgi:hypothetical protein
MGIRVIGIGIMGIRGIGPWDNGYKGYRALR